MSTTPPAARACVQLHLIDDSHAKLLSDSFTITVKVGKIQYSYGARTIGFGELSQDKIQTIRNFSQVVLNAYGLLFEADDQSKSILFDTLQENGISGNVKWKEKEKEMSERLHIQRYSNLKGIQKNLIVCGDVSLGLAIRSTEKYKKKSEEKPPVPLDSLTMDPIWAALYLHITTSISTPSLPPVSSDPALNTLVNRPSPDGVSETSQLQNSPVHQEKISSELQLMEELNRLDASFALAKLAYDDFMISPPKDKTPELTEHRLENIKTTLGLYIGIEKASRKIENLSTQAITDIQSILLKKSALSKMSGVLEDKFFLKVLNTPLFQAFSRENKLALIFAYAELCYYAPKEFSSIQKTKVLKNALSVAVTKLPIDPRELYEALYHGAKVKKLLKQLNISESWVNNEKYKPPIEALSILATIRESISLRARAYTALESLQVDMSPNNFNASLDTQFRVLWKECVSLITNPTAGALLLTDALLVRLDLLLKEYNYLSANANDPVAKNIDILNRIRILISDPTFKKVLKSPLFQKAPDKLEIAENYSVLVLLHSQPQIKTNAERLTITQQQVIRLLQATGGDISNPLYIVLYYGAALAGYRKSNPNNERGELISRESKVNEFLEGLNVSSSIDDSFEENVPKLNAEFTAIQDESEILLQEPKENFNELAGALVVRIDCLVFGYNQLKGSTNSMSGIAYIVHELTLIRETLLDPSLQFNEEES